MLVNLTGNDPTRLLEGALKIVKAISPVLASVASPKVDGMLPVSLLCPMSNCVSAVILPNSGESLPVNSLLPGCEEIEYEV